MKKNSGKNFNLNGKIIDHKGTVYLIMGSKPTTHPRMSWMKRVLNLELMTGKGLTNNLVVGLGSNGWCFWDDGKRSLVYLEIVL